MQKIIEKNEIPSLEELKKMKEQDIRDVNKEELVDIKNVVINQNLPEEERLIDFLRQIKNPYCYLDHGIIVKIAFSEQRKLENALRHYLENFEK